MLAATESGLPPQTYPKLESASGASLLLHAESLLSGSARFDVHAARELAQRMVAMADEQAVFEDWCRDRGLGPEASHWRDWHDFDRDGLPRRPPGWPGNLAREYADAMVKCNTCLGGEGWLEPAWPEDPWTRCPACRDARKRFTMAPMGRSVARVGQRLLDMLDGNDPGKPGCAWAPSAPPQPSECQTCGGWVQATAKLAEAQAGPRPPDPVVVDMLQPCPDCKGTGHNLRGFVPMMRARPGTRPRSLASPRRASTG